MASTMQSAFFTIPPVLQVVPHQPESYRQQLSIANPYPFNVDVRISNPSTLRVNISAGRVNNGNHLDVIVRYIGPLVPGLGEALRITYHDIGNVNVPVVLKRKSDVPEEKKPVAAPQPPRPEHNPAGLLWVAIIAMVACTIMLLIPAHGSPGASASRVPEEYHPSANLQLAASFILGAVCMYLMCKHNGQL